ncbi:MULTISPECIES: glycosyltransferase family 2 protein [unclassified Leeuwenhoekiella]|uniref:glycosyltransferase family 2 protein n=1 Tax=unclassified Leeuwenhoekiella TaxID=2615029 RepID=UPI000C45C8E4|nr:MULTISPECIES: glycosyltransferase family A protein [unclassified Leeuwenhoekiella]MAW96676.1 glycosyl transferase [Leeuwenhoekiella sp.]MBA81565.1 glycosyl transferase [Leeuwenhoekiella sp.]
MILLKHTGSKPVAVSKDGQPLEFQFQNQAVSAACFLLAEKFPDESLIWFHEDVEHNLNLEFIQNLSSKLEMLSYAAKQPLAIAEVMGFVDQSVFFRIQPDVKYPTWLMSSAVGSVSCKALLHFKKDIPAYPNFDLFLCVLAKTGMLKGLRVYSEPRLIRNSAENAVSFTKNLNTTYTIIAALMGAKWLLLFELQRLLYQKKQNILRLLKSFQIRRINSAAIPELTIDTSELDEVKNELNFDVVIPTLGRKQALKQTLDDLSSQILVPQCVILIEQNPEVNAVSELDYLQTESWPFEVKHTFTHQTGACNARNLALDQVEADWVFLADDDLRIPKDFLKQAQAFIQAEKPQAFTVSCLQDGEIEPEKTVIQWPAFGSGCSFVKASTVKTIRFDLALEHGFGEDADFGMQLRKAGVDILYNPFLKLIHLKAPSGGFRKPIEKPWDKENPAPKPAPTVLASIIKHATPAQILGYKTLLFLKFYKLQQIKNPFSYIRQMRKRWEVSLFWAKKLLNTK